MSPTAPTAANPKPTSSPPEPGPDAGSAARRRGLIWLVRPARLDGCRGPWQFLLRLTVQNFLANAIIAIPLVLMSAGGDHPAADVDFSVPGNFWRVALALVLVAPLLETLFLQTAPIETSRALGFSRLVQFISGVVPFAALHFPMGIKVGIAAGTVAGAFLSHAYLEGRTRSFWTATWLTMGFHAIHNLICTAILLFAFWAGCP